VYLFDRASTVSKAVVPKLAHGQVTIIFVVSVGFSVCLFVCAEFFSAIFVFLGVLGLKKLSRPTVLIGLS